MEARFRRFTIFLFAWGFCACVSTPELIAQQPPYPAQKDEVAWYTLISIEDSQRLAQAFEKKYPGIGVKVFRNRETALLPRIISEAQSGRRIADVVSVRGIGYYQLWKRNLIQPYLSPESRFYPSGFHDIVQPQLRAKIGMDNEETEWFAGLTQYWSARSNSCGSSRRSRFAFATATR
jgi:ABC-type glycerol-3-phosphate transport system substrate-binding protein